MIESLLSGLDEKLFPKDGWLRTCFLTFGIGTSALFCIKYILSSRRPICKNDISLSGKTCIVTGANNGIGKAVALELARRNARVILACRDIQKGNNAAVDIRNELQNSTDVVVYQLDLASFESVRHFAEHIKDNEDSIDILINNAGVMGCPFIKSEDGMEMHFAVNHLGHFLLTNLLIDSMKNRDDSRIIIVSSSKYKKANVDLVNYSKEDNYDPLMAYGRSKLANILFSHELNKKLPTGITVNSLHPGMVWTDLGRHQLTNIITRYLFGVFAYFLIKTPAEGAQTIIHMATEPYMKGISGKYFGNCQMEDLKDIAKDDKLSEKLWEISEELTGCKWQL